MDVLSRDSRKDCEGQVKFLGFYVGFAKVNG